MRREKKIKVVLEYRNALGMPVTVTKRLYERELVELMSHNDVTVLKYA